MRIKIAIFGSGSGTNAENIIEYFHKDSSIEVSLVVSNKADAYILERAKRHNVPFIFLNKAEILESDVLLSVLAQYQIDFIVLAGFLLQIPSSLINRYPNKIVNIHPALLPKHGGKGMYGDRVHQAVVADGDTQSGITIHYVDEHYDSGAVIFQATCEVLPADSSSEVATKVHQLEYAHFPRIIKEVVLANNKL